MLKRNTNTKINLPAQLDNYYIRILRACHTLAITVNDRVTHEKIFKIIQKKWRSTDSHDPERLSSVHKRMSSVKVT